MRLTVSLSALSSLRCAVAMVTIGGALLVAGCDYGAEDVASIVKSGAGDSRAGAALIKQYGCGGCHVVPGIAGAEGVVGPPLTMIGRRVYIAGVLRNSPDNLVAWLEDPQAIVPGNVMPTMGINPNQARDIAAYLYTLR